VTYRNKDRVPFKVGSQWEQSIFPAEAFRAGAVDVTATASGEGGVEGLQIPFLPQHFRLLSAQAKVKAVDPDFDRIPQRGLTDFMKRNVSDEHHRQQFAPMRCASLGESHHVTSITGLKV